MVGKAMEEYRIYFIGRDGHIQNRLELLCESDEAAKERAEQPAR
jgi:hypothetical protein